MEIVIPENTESTRLEAEAKARQEALVNTITSNIIDALSRYDKTNVCCSDHMRGRGGYDYRTTIEVAKKFVAKGYYAYHRTYVNNFGVTQKEVIVSKGPQDMSGYRCPWTQL